MPQKDQIERTCYLVNADGKVLGRLAARVSAILRGKHKVQFTPHMDTGDSVVVINAGKIKVTGKKLRDKVYQRYSGYPSGRKLVALEDMLKKKPTQILRTAINGMIPRNPMGYHQRSKLKVYTGDSHPHVAQKPITLQI